MSDNATGAAALNDPRPMVARPASPRNPWLLGAMAAILALGLFAVLEARRSARSVDPLVPIKVAGGEAITPPQPLAIPEIQQQIIPLPLGENGRAVPLSNSAPTLPPAPSPRQTAPVRLSSAPPADYYPPVVPQTPPLLAAPATVYQAPTAPLPTADLAQRGFDRVKAARFANPSMTVPQGAVIQAVLETAVDSTRPGPARAIVSRDVRSFDGSRVLIPRGSRLFGEYKADLSSGQNRAMIQWTRLMRPDGVTIALDSPSADPLGRAGVKGKVNSHFWPRLGSALMQTMLNLGFGYATNEATGGTIILGLPGSTQTVAPQQTESFKPTLKVAQGTPVSVFVTRDLDFSEVEQ